MIYQIDSDLERSEDMEIKKIQMTLEEEEQTILFHPETSSDMVKVGEVTLDEELLRIDQNIVDTFGKLNYTNDTPMISPLGGYKAGTTFDNVSLSEFLTGLLYPYMPPKISISANPGAAVRDYDNPLTSVTLTASVTKQSEAIKWVEFFKGSTSLQRFNELGDNVSFNTTHEETIRTTTTFTAKVSDGTQTVTSNLITYTFVYPFYVGATSESSLNQVTLSASDKVVKTKGNTSKKYTTTQERFYIAYPASYGNLTSILDANQFEILPDFEKGTKTVTMLDQSTVPYTVYLFKNAVTVADFTVTFKF